MIFTGTEKEAWILLTILMLSFEIDSGMAQFPYALSNQISKDMNFALSAIYFFISISNIPNIFLPCLLSSFLHKHALKIFGLCKL